MPLFDYLCPRCGAVSEHLVFGDDAPRPCPECQSTGLKRLMGAPSSLSGVPTTSLPGKNDTACCGSAPGHGSCAGPGSCCGKA